LVESIRQAWRRATVLGWCILAAGCAVAAWAVLPVRPVAAAITFGGGLAAMILAAAIDVALQRLPNVLTIGAAMLGLVVLPVVTWATGDGLVWRAAAGGVIFGGWILIGALALRDSYGFGDIKLAAACGIYATWLSWQTLIVAIIATQLAIAAALLYGRLRGRERMPLGPVFVAGLLVAAAFAT
jgi:prepilin signal peptidase PulO-like enzyme (type II secretory pathway)